MDRRSNSINKTSYQCI